MKHDDERRARRVSMTVTLFTALAALLAGACESRSVVGTGNTNWLQCATSDVCPAEMVCECRYCVSTCDGVLECQDGDRAPLCDGVEVERATSGDGPSQDSPVLRVAAHDETSAATLSLDSCGWFSDDMAEPVAVTTTSVQVQTANRVSTLVADDSGLYWFEGNGRVMTTAPDGSGEPRVLRNSDTTLWEARMALDDAYAYWTEQDPVSSANDRPSSRVYRVAKNGGEAELLYETTDRFMGLHATPNALRVAVITDPLPTLRVYEIAADGSDANLVLDASGLLVTFEGDEIFWLNEFDQSGAFNLVVQNLNGGQAEVLTTFYDNGGFVPFGRRILLVTGGDIQRMSLLDRDAGCEQPLPYLGESIADLILDDTHAYWGSYRNWIDNDDGPRSFLRTHLTTGLVEQLEVSGFEYTLETDVLGQSDGALYFTTADGFAIVQKP